ncbi:MAG: sensor histidine kinase [Anaerolineae bacterium]
MGNLRSRLIVSHTLVVILALVLAGLSLLLLLREYQDQILFAQLASRSNTLAFRLALDLRETASDRGFDDVLGQVAHEEGVRLLLLDRTGAVVGDSVREEGLVGERFRILPRLILEDPRVAHTDRYTTSDGEEMILSLLPVPGRLRGEIQFVALATSTGALAGPAVDLILRLAWAGVLALVVAVSIGVVLARSVAGPLGALTRASEAMARGDYDPAVPATGDGEVGRLSAAFRAMAQEVRRSRQAQRDFLANISHDLKTPLTSIAGFSQAILDGAAEGREATVKAARVIHRESARMEGMVRDLLDLARLDAGVSMERKPVDLSALLGSVVETYRSRAKEKGIGFLPDIGTGLRAQGDADRLTQVFSNLLDNAFKYTPEGGEVALSGMVSAGEVRVAVADTGPGVPLKDLPNIFSRFYRVEKSRTKGSGAGLGLAIAKEMVEAHGGRIEAWSRPGEGTRFTVVLPAP